MSRCSRNSHAVRLSIDQLGDRKLADAVDAREQTVLALIFGRLRLGGLHLGDIHVEEADRVTLEALALRLFVSVARVSCCRSYGHQVRLHALAARSPWG